MNMLKILKKYKRTGHFFPNIEKFESSDVKFKKNEIAYAQESLKNIALKDEKKNNIININDEYKEKIKNIEINELINKRKILQDELDQIDQDLVNIKQIYVKNMVLDHKKKLEEELAKVDADYIKKQQELKPIAE